jgi:hypothetical protein
MNQDVQELQDTIKRLHGIKATHIKTVQVKESFDGKTVWEGDVEVFDLQGHPKAKRAYAWIHGLDDTKAKRHVTVLAVPPITSPEAAVKAVILNDYRKKEK